MFAYTLAIDILWLYENFPVTLIEAYKVANNVATN